MCKILSYRGSGVWYCKISVKMKRLFSTGLEKRNKIALVTGGSGVIGREICLSLASKGCKVIVHYNTNQSSAQKIVEEINSKWSSSHGSEGFAIAADCSNYTSTKSMYDQIVQKYGTLDILVNNAGIKRDKLSMKMSSQDFIEVVSTNINSTFFCSQLAYSIMMRKKIPDGLGGRIVNIASIVGQVGNIGQVNYATSKGGIIAMTRSLAKEYSHKNVCVNAVCPGYIESEMVSDLFSSKEKEREREGEREGTLNQEKINKLIETIPLRRLGKASEVASLVSFLSLDEAGGYMTGHCLNIDGGLAIGAT